MLDFFQLLTYNALVAPAEDKRSWLKAVHIYISMFLTSLSCFSPFLLFLIIFSVCRCSFLIYGRLWHCVQWEKLELVLLGNDEISAVLVCINPHFYLYCQFLFSHWKGLLPMSAWQKKWQTRKGYDADFVVGALISSWCEALGMKLLLLK